MRRILFCCLLLLPLCACAPKAPEAIDLDLYSDRGFAFQVAEIFEDAAQYEGAAIRLTGQYYTSGDYDYILRTAPDGEPSGFELAWEGEAPASGQWVLAVGRLQSYIEGDARYLQVSAQQLFLTGRCSERLTIREEHFLSDLAELYENADEHLGAQVTLTGRYGAYVGGHYVFRTVEYLDGRTAQVGVELLPLSAPPAAGEWITVTGTLCAYERSGEQILTLADAVLTAAPAGEEPIKEAP